MLRRRLNFSSLFPSAPAASFSSAACTSAAFLSSLRLLSSGDRDDLSRVVSSVQSEAKGQHVDLSDMADATRNALKQVQDATKRVNFSEDPRLKAKVTTLQTALKAYSGRVANVQSEARSLQSDAEKVLKMLFGEDNATTGSSSSSSSSSGDQASSSSSSSVSSSASSSTKPKVTEAEAVPTPAANLGDDFSFEAPSTAQKLEYMNQQAAGTPLESMASGNTVSAEEIVVETLDEEPRGSGTSSSSSSSSPNSGTDEANQIRADETPIGEITQTLHLQGIDFSDCREARQLRQRYKDYLDGKFIKKQAPPKPNTDQPPPRTSSGYQQPAQPQQSQQSANTTETGITSDPNPNAQRKYLDTSRLVGDIKAEIARDNNVKPEQIDLWAGMTLLEDKKRLYEYPNLQSQTIEVRQKGDKPRPQY